MARHSAPVTTRLSRRMEHRIEILPGAFEKLCDVLPDWFRDGPGNDPMNSVLQRFSQHERRSLKVFFDDILSGDYSDAEIELLWSKIPSYASFADMYFISNLRAFFEALRRELG